MRSLQHPSNLTKIALKLGQRHVYPSMDTLGQLTNLQILKLIGEDNGVGIWLDFDFRMEESPKL